MGFPTRFRGHLGTVPAWFWPVAIVAVAAALRIVPWLANYPLHRDEALYGAWARLLLAGRDPALSSVPVDKPPLVLYLLAGSMGLFGASEYALRLPGLLAGIALPAVTFGLARLLGGRRPALLASALVAASPFAILFAPTAFTDPWLALWLLAAAWAALARRPLLGGLFLGLAVASKQTGVLGLPLVLLLIVISLQDERPRSQPAPTAPGSLGRQSAGGMRRGHGHALACAGLALVTAPVIYWDSLRWPSGTSFWTRSLETYGGLHLVAIAQWPARAAEWAGPLGYLFGRPVMTAPVLLLAGLATWQAAAALGLYSRGERTLSITRAILRSWPAAAGAERLDGNGSASAISPVTARAYVVLGGYVVVYLAVHLCLSFQPWDRYALPLVPLLAILAARGAQLVWGWLRGCSPAQAVLRASAAAAAGVLLVYGAWLGQAAALPVGSDHYAYAGLPEAAAIVHRLPWSAVVYQRSLGWQLDFYMFDAPPPHIWWESPTTLADDAEYGVKFFPDRQQWLVLANAVDGPVEANARAALAGRGLGLVERQRIERSDGTTSFVLYQILPLANPAGDHPSTSGGARG